VSRPRAKPQADDAEAIKRLCEYLVTGMSMRRACEKPDVTCQTSVYIKMAEDEAFCAIIARAREAQQIALIDETQDMADAATAEDWQVVRLRIWQRQWTAGKLASRIYGDKVQLANAAGDGNAAVHVKVELVGKPALAGGVEQPQVEQNPGRSRLPDDVRKSISLVGQR
jgi:hypothetical protein